MQENTEEKTLETADEQEFKNTSLEQEVTSDDTTPKKKKKKKPLPPDGDGEDDEDTDEEDTEDADDDSEDDDDDDTETSGSDAGSEDENELKQEEKKPKTIFKNPFEFFVKPENQALKQKNNAPDKPQRSPLQKFFDVLLYGVEGAKIRNGELPKTAIADELLLGLGFKAYLKDVLLNKQIAKFWKQKVAGKDDSSLLKTGMKALKKRGIKDAILNAFIKKKDRLDEKAFKTISTKKVQQTKLVDEQIKTATVSKKEASKEAVKAEEKKDILEILNTPVRPAKVGQKQEARKKLVITKENAQEILKAVELKEQKIKDAEKNEQLKKEKISIAEQKSLDMQQKDAQKAVAALAASFANTEKAQAQSQNQAQKESAMQHLQSAVQSDKAQLAALAQSQDKNANMSQLMAEKNQMLANQKGLVDTEQSNAKKGMPAGDISAVLAPMLAGRRMMKKPPMPPAIKRALEDMAEHMPKPPRRPENQGGASAKFVAEEPKRPQEPQHAGQDEAKQSVLAGAGQRASEIEPKVPVQTNTQGK